MIYGLYSLEHEGYLKLAMDGHGDFNFVGWKDCDDIGAATFEPPIDFFKTQILSAKGIRNFFAANPVIIFGPDMYLVPFIDGEFNFGLAVQLNDLLRT